MGKVDVRIVKLNKWYVPKTHSLGNIEGEVAIGHFDSVEIEKGQIDTSEVHPFIGGYQTAMSHKMNKKHTLVDHSTQELMVFTNVAEMCDEHGSCFSEGAIRNFWEDNSSPYLFLSMIHIEHIGKLKNALTLIRETFRENYLSYISFDYCDIVIFAKKLYVREFLDKIRNLFLLEGQEIGNPFFDTFSLITFTPNYPTRMAEGLISKTYFDVGGERDKFQATVNVSVKDYSAFSAWHASVKKEYPRIETYNMFGRHDVSIVNNEADTKFLMYMMQELHGEQGKNSFWTFETFIKVRDDSVAGRNIGSGVPEKRYESVKKQLETMVEELSCRIQESNLINKESFLLPIYEVRDCVCSIVKNNFAEEFVYCIYDSFKHFIQYMSNSVQKLNAGEGGGIITEEKIADSYNEYFTALNTLVNSTMHSDRQFVQATAFNAIFYSVPPKIMAFYNAYVYRLKSILKDIDCEEEYSYLLYPSFSHFMGIKQVSLEDKPPCSRILTAKLSEKTIYDVAPVCFQLVHELAHFIGDGVRCREERARYMFSSLLQSIIAMSQIQDAQMIKLLKVYLNEVWLKKKCNDIYLQCFEENSGLFYQELKLEFENEVKDFFIKYYENEELNVPGDKFLSEYGLSMPARTDYRRLYSKQYYKYVCERVRELLESMQEKEKLRLYNGDVILLKSTYSESYADLQMILILSVSPRDYLNMFSKNCVLPMEQLFCSPEDAIRVSLIFKIMLDCGFWKEYSGNNTSLKNVILQITQYVEKSFEEADNEIKAIWDEKKRKINLLMESYVEDAGELVFDKRAEEGNYDIGNVSKWVDLGSFTYITYGLYDYLLDVMQKALIEYFTLEKKAKIRAVHTTVKTLLAADDMVEVYNCIEEEIEQYKEQLFGAES